MGRSKDFRQGTGYNSRKEPFLEGLLPQTLSTFHQNYVKMFIEYCMAKKSWSILNINLQYNVGQAFLESIFFSFTTNKLEVEISLLADLLLGKYILLL